MSRTSRSTGSPINPAPGEPWRYEAEQRRMGLFVRQFLIDSKLPKAVVIVGTMTFCAPQLFAEAMPPVASTTPYLSDAIPHILVNSVAAIIAGVITSLVLIAYHRLLPRQVSPKEQGVFWHFIGGAFSPVLFVAFPSLFLKDNVQLLTVLVASPVVAVTWKSVIERLKHRSDSIAKKIVDGAENALSTMRKGK